MSNDIRTDAGRTAGQWSGVSAEGLQAGLVCIRENIPVKHACERLVAREMPYRALPPEDLHSFKVHHIWGCDQGGDCLAGTHANRIESLASARSFSSIDQH
jgi:hypothetical protein